MHRKIKMYSITAASALLFSSATAIHTFAIDPASAVRPLVRDGVDMGGLAPEVKEELKANPEANAPGEAARTAAVEQRAQKVIDRATAYLKSQQQADGGWQKAAAEPIGITALVLRAVATDPKTRDADWVKKGYAKLLGAQLENGGIYKDSLANYNTAIAISAMAAAGPDAYSEQMKKAVQYLKSLQWNDMIVGPKGEKNIDPKNPFWGGVGYDSKGRPDGSNINIFIDALHDAGVPKDDPAYKNAMIFVSRMQNRSESNDQKWAGEDGGFIYTPAGNGESKAGDFTTPEGDRRLRSYGSMTYAGLKSMIYAGISKDDPRVKAAWDWITANWSLVENPGMRQGDPAKATQGMYYYYHTLARALHAYGEPVISNGKSPGQDWRVQLIDHLAKLQHDNGSFVGEKRWYEDNPTLATAYTIMALREAVEDLRQHPVGGK